MAVYLSVNYLYCRQSAANLYDTRNLIRMDCILLAFHSWMLYRPSIVGSSYTVALLLRRSKATISLLFKCVFCPCMPLLALPLPVNQILRERAAGVQPIC